MPELRVHFLPERIPPAGLIGSQCVVVDVLRATTTIVSALAAGARAVLPCLSVDEARKLASSLPPDDAILGGERGGVRIEGFGLGNSPAEYTAPVVRGKTVVLTTTNGTKALLHCHPAADVLIGAFVNLSALCARLTSHTAEAPVDIVCSGTESRATRDDVLVAGAVAARLASSGPWQLDDQAALARDGWLAVSGGSEGHELSARVAAALRETRGGRNLVQLGMDDDLVWAADVDRFGIVPCFDKHTHRIEALVQ